MTFEQVRFAAFVADVSRRFFEETQRDLSYYMGEYEAKRIEEDFRDLCEPDSCACWLKMYIFSYEYKKD